MKNIFLLLFLFSIHAYGQVKKQEKSLLIIPPKQIVQLNYPYFKGYRVKLWNKSKFDVGVTARHKATDSIHRGFGLGKGGEATLVVESDEFIQFENRFLAPLKVEYIVYKGPPRKKKTASLTPQRGFYLVNSTGQRLPLLIPGVMNPNLSPFSKSGVDLPLGQKIYLKTGGKKLLIFTVTDTIPKGARVDVADLIDLAINPKE